MINICCRFVVCGKVVCFKLVWDYSGVLNSYLVGLELVEILYLIFSIMLVIELVYNVENCNVNCF